MNVEEAFTEFLSKLSDTEVSRIRREELFAAFVDFEKVLELTRMSQKTRDDLLIDMAQMAIQVQIPEEKHRDQFFNRIEHAVEALNDLQSPDLKWGGFCGLQLEQILATKSGLKELFECQTTWVRGRRPELNQFQLKAMKQLYDRLQKSRYDKKTKTRWQKFRIEEIGRFSAENSSSDQTYMATPAKMISNFGTALGFVLSESTVKNQLKSRSHLHTSMSNPRLNDAVVNQTHLPVR
jgi:hypothetical protein